MRDFSDGRAKLIEDHHPVRRESFQIRMSDPGQISSQNTGQALRLSDTQAFPIKTLHDFRGEKDCWPIKNSARAPFKGVGGH